MYKSNWDKVRQAFKRTIPNSIDKDYLSKELNISPESARANILSPLKFIGLVDEENKPTKLAYDWRNDKKYSYVCSQLLENIYSTELTQNYDDPNLDFGELKNWFMDSAGCGESAAYKYAKFYLILVEGKTGIENDVKKKPTKKKNTTIKPDKLKINKNILKETHENDEMKSQSTEHPEEFTSPQHSSGNKSINIHFHVTADTDIEKIKFLVHLIKTEL